MKGHEAVVRLLLEKGADIDRTTGSGRTALHLAAMSGHLAVVRLLLEKGADVDGTTSNGQMALHSAAVRGDEAATAGEEGRRRGGGQQ
jgi:ankyrin repeat protein